MILSQVSSFGCWWWSCGKAGCVGEVVDRVLVGGGGTTQRAGCGLVGEVGQAGGYEPVMQSGQEHGGVQTVVGDLVAVGVGDPLDEAMGA